MTNYKTTIGGAVSSLGTGLIGASILPQLAGQHDDWLWYTTCVGYVINLIGKFLTSLFAADAATVKDLGARLNAADIPQTPPVP